MSVTLTKELYEELGAAMRGEVHPRQDSEFIEYSSIFNGNVVSSAKAVALPLDAEDVSTIVKFCNKHGLSLSVKAGGYGTAGWAVGGDIIIDVCKLRDIDIEPPNEDGSYTSLRDVASTNSKGKRSVLPAPTTGKRLREEDAGLRVYDAASSSVATLLRGTPSDGPAPAKARRIETLQESEPSSSHPDQSGSPFPVEDDSRLSASVSASASASPHDDFDREYSASTMETSPSPLPSEAGVRTSPPSTRVTALPSSNADPFGYLDEPVAKPPPVLIPMNYPTTSLTAWGARDATNTPVQSEAIHPHAFVTFGAGMRQKQIDEFTDKNKLEARYISGSGDGIPYHVPFAAHPVGSSIMILGGFGFLSRLHGLSIDNLVEVEMVLANGKIVIVNEQDHPDLWWAVRGAGPALGIATRYKAKAYPVPVVFAGNLIYRFNKATAPSLIKHFRDCVKGAPPELYANVLLTAGPAGKDSLMVVQMCYVGSREKGQEYLAAISSWDGEKCLLNEVNEKSFFHQQDSVAQVLRGKAGRQWFIRSALISALPDDIVNDTVMEFANTPVGCTWLFELAGGEISKCTTNCIPKSQREAAFTIAALHQWEMDIEDDECVDAAEGWIHCTLKDVHVGGPFPSFLGRHEPPERTKACFGENWERLREIKNFYDPDNVFRYSFWPLDAQGETVEPETHEPPTPEYLVTSLRPKSKGKGRAH